MNKLPLIRKPSYVHNPAKAKKKPARKIRDSYSWKKTSVNYIKLHPMCECGCSQLAREIDHVLSLSKGGHPTDHRNLMALSIACHETKSKLEQEIPIIDKKSIGQYYIPEDRLHYVEYINTWNNINTVEKWENFINKIKFGGRGV